jgi:hypothetical protein
MEARSVAIVDCDTTGVAVQDVPVSISVVLTKEDTKGDWQEVDSWYGEQQPSVPITEAAHAIHGMTVQSLQDKVFDVAELRHLLGQANFLVSTHAQFDAKMLAKVVPDVLQMDWRNIPASRLTDIPAVGNESHQSVPSSHAAERLFAHLRQRQGKTMRSKPRLTLVLEGGRMPVHPHLHDDLPLVVTSEAIFGKLFTRTLSTCPIGTQFRLWTREGMDYIAAYASGYCGGQGLSFHLPKDKNREMAASIERGEHPVAQLVSVAGFVYDIHIAKS